MQRVVFEDFLGSSSNSHQIAVELARIPLVDIRSIEQDDRALWSFRSNRWRCPEHFLQLTAGVSLLESKGVTRNRGFDVATRQHC